MNDPRHDNFVPLMPAAPARPDASGLRIEVMPAAEAPASFQPLTPPAAPGPAIAAGAHHSAHEPQITLHRDGDRITGIQVKCCCGRVIELACVY